MHPRNNKYEDFITYLLAGNEWKKAAGDADVPLPEAKRYLKNLPTSRGHDAE